MDLEAALLDLEAATEEFLDAEVRRLAKINYPHLIIERVYSHGFYTVATVEGDVGNRNPILYDRAALLEVART